MVTTTAVWEINNKHFSELIGLFLGNLQVTTVVNQISQDVDLKYRIYSAATISHLCKMTAATIQQRLLVESSICNVIMITVATIQKPDNFTV